MSKAKTETVTGKFPVTTFTAKGEAVPPGEKNTIPKAVAEQIESLHGTYDEPDTAKSKPATTKPVEVKVADLDDPAVKAAIDEAKAEALAPVVAAWEAMATLPADADEAAVNEASAAMAAALGLQG